MLIGLISDVHANLEALDACLEKCAEAGVGRLFFLGDIVGYGPDPEAVVQRVMQLAAQGAGVILGNHDEAATGTPTRMNEVATAAIEWTKPRLSQPSRAFLHALPLSIEENGILMVHADASQPAAWRYVTCAVEAHQSLSATRAQLVLSGHVHVPQLYCLTATAKIIGHRPVTGVAVPLLAQRRWLAVIGSAGQPRDGNPSAAFATYDTSTCDLVFRRAPYDVEATVAKIRASNLPERLAQRLLVGQ